MKRGIYTVMIFFVLATAGCYYDKGELIYPPVSTQTPATCDTSSVKYSVDVVNILSANCYSCHGGSAGGGSGYILDTYNGVKTFTNGTNTRLVRAIEHTGPVNTHMPQGGPKLDACAIAKIRTWVRNGAPNN